MAGATKGGNSRGNRVGGNRARSVGAAASGHPNGAILDDTSELLSEQSKRFKAWAKGYRDKKLTDNAFVKMYKTSPHPIKGGS